MTRLPIDIWLIIWDFIGDSNTLWSVLRKVSQYVRACIDEYFRRHVLRKIIINLTYSTIHSSIEIDSRGHNFHFLHLPMQFSRLSEDVTHAVFRQVRLRNHEPSNVRKLIGSIRGWVPFIERYHREMHKRPPIVLNKSKSVGGPVLWEVYHPKERGRWYTRDLRDLTSIGRGDRPPYAITVGDYTHDTELVDLSLDCTAREISIDWRRTLSAFFMERQFIVLANYSTTKKRVYDKDLERVVDSVRIITRRDHIHITCSRDMDDWRRARRKRLQPWVKKNHKRMSREHRLMTEDSVVRIAGFINNKDKRRRSDYDHLRASGVDQGESVPYNYLDEFVELQDEDMDTEEIVPDMCACDHPDLMKWPANRAERKKAEAEVKTQTCTCVII
jgi:hypothetical protein